MIMESRTKFILETDAIFQHHKIDPARRPILLADMQILHDQLYVKLWALNSQFLEYKYKQKQTAN